MCNQAYCNLHLARSYNIVFFLKINLFESIFEAYKRLTYDKSKFLFRQLRQECLVPHVTTEVQREADERELLIQNQFVS